MSIHALLLHLLFMKNVEKVDSFAFGVTKEFRSAGETFSKRIFPHSAYVGDHLNGFYFANFETGQLK